MTRIFKQKTAAAILVLTTILLLVTLGLSGNLAKAQTTADSVTVIIPPAIGGTTNPAAGTYTYTTNDTKTLTAIPDSGYVFQYFIVSGDYTSGHTPAVPTNVTDPDTGEVIGVFPSLPSIPATGIDSLVVTANPILIAHGFGYTYTWQAVFAPVGSTNPTPLPSGQVSDTVTVVIEPTTGGTTSPASGTYTYTTAQGDQTLTATPAAGYEFKYFIVSGNYTSGHTQNIALNITDPVTGETLGTFPSFSQVPDLTGIDNLVITTNPILISHGFGYTYTWQAVFAPISTTSPSPTAIATASPTTAPTQSATPIATTSPEVTASPGGSGGLSTTVIAAIVVVIIIIIIVAVVVVMMMRRKK